LNARAWGRNGAVVVAPDCFISDVSREFNDGLDQDHSIFYTLRQIKATQIEGTVAVVGTAGADIYYHWMMDVLPRLALINKMLPLDSIDYFITEFGDHPFQYETLKKAGIPSQKIIKSNDNWHFHVKASRLIVPSLAGELDQPNLFQVQYLQKLFGDIKSRALPGRRIYISRKNTGRRMIVNEEDVLQLLSKYSFEIIQCEDLSVEEQVAIFSGSSAIIGSHGSAMTNLVFCAAGTKVIDLFNPSHINPCFWYISQWVNLEYHVLLGTAHPIDGNPKNDNTMVDVAQLKMKLNDIGIYA
jgi:capsular polysaccharide biosynthesis protein